MEDITKTLGRMNGLKKPVTSDAVTNEQITAKSEKVGKVIKAMGFDDRCEKNFKTITRYLARIILKCADRGLLITGDTGTGKSFAMMLIAKQRKGSRKQAGYVTAQDFSTDVSKRGSYEVLNDYVGGLKAEAWHDGRWDMRSYEPVDLILDDLGSETSSVHYGVKSEPIVELIAARYDHWRATGALTHITTNLTTSQIEERYGKRISSRLFEMCYVTSFAGDDRRKDR